MDTTATNTGEFRAPRETDQEEWRVRIREEMTRMMMPFMMEKEEIEMARILETERKKLKAEMNEKLKAIREKEKEKEKEKEQERRETRKEKRKRNEKEKGKRTGRTAKRQTRSRIGGEEEELDTEIEIDGGGLEEEEAETLREEESEDDEEESSEEEIREIKRRNHKVTEDNRGCGKRRDQAICREGAREDSREGKHQEDPSRNGKHACRGVVQPVFN